MAHLTVLLLVITLVSARALPPLIFPAFAIIPALFLNPCLILTPRPAAARPAPFRVPGVGGALRRAQRPFAQCCWTVVLRLRHWYVVSRPRPLLHALSCVHC
ncbi:hypothetical protein BCR44DRAFT_1428487 [Catenaria anguillulae PL171]|uniref:Secreted peptide n=1 Tax=Catenaria anguillulae PL171 TaxID=765915 RepID=A0A1Y2HVC0_9FUNG|nr:hypothetical protein BCR44DRAFT_1428487 [Catenaria anguillulae PL171]